MRYFVRISEWSKYQHYKDRNPPWIKLHKELLMSQTWVSLDDASRVLAIASMVIASATDNKIPLDGCYIKRVAYLNSDPDFNPLVNCGFVEIIDVSGSVLADASKLLALCKQSVQNARPETETETETETEKTIVQKSKKQNPSAHIRSLDSVFEKAYQAYPRHVGKGAAKKAWLKATGRAPDDDMLYQRVMSYAAATKTAHTEKQFIPHMSTWLNEDRFLDDPSEWAVAGKTNGNGHKPQASKTIDAEEEYKQRLERKRKQDAQDRIDHPELYAENVH